MKIMHKAVYTCEQASSLIVQKKENKLSLNQRFRLWMHLLMCDACRRFNIQNEWLDKQLHRLAHTSESHAHAHTMSEKAKEELRNKLASQKNN